MYIGRLKYNYLDNDFSKKFQPKNSSQIVTIASNSIKHMVIYLI